MRALHLARVISSCDPAIMVSTRNHPSELPPPDVSPSKSGPMTAGGSPRKGRKSTSPPSAGAQPSRHGGGGGGSARWAHVTTPLTLLWLCVSLPLVTWDTLYVFLRPHTLPGGQWQHPIWTLYSIYARVDHMYGWPAWDAGDGWTAAQSLINCLESAVYVAYLAVVLAHGRPAAAGEEAALQGRRRGWEQTWVGRTNVVEGVCGARASLAGFAGATMTLSKTFLYCAWTLWVERPRRVWADGRADL